MNMIEKVARAICLACDDDPDKKQYHFLSDSDQPIWKEYAIPARAAIEAMREASDAQVQAGWATYNDSFQIEPKMRSLWEAMIDASLTSPKGKGERG